VADYRQLVARVNAGDELRHYPGSPSLARMLLRPQDQLRLFELHPNEYPALLALVVDSPGAEVRQVDGFAALKSQLPPPTRRALVLVDPSYEGHGDYRRVLDMMGEALRRFAQGVYMVWYPVVAKPGAAAMVQGLKSLAPKGWLHARLTVQPTDAQGFGLAGSGIVVLNPPHTLHAELHALLPWLAQALGQGTGTSHLLQQHAP
jgi:23S rRNA (adenine2030-N6)-methyltransferase